jgi:hypothetical protein
MGIDTASYSQGKPLTLVDAHVHFHPGFDPLRFFRSARANFSKAAGALGISGPWAGVLILMESAGSREFEGFLDRADRPQTHSLHFGRTSDRRSVRVETEESRNQGESPILLVAGAQVQTAEGLEVLIFPTRSPPSDGLPMEEIIAGTRKAGALAILPWGFGKWTFGRAQLISELIETRRPIDFLLSDTGHRPRFAAYPRLLDRGGEVGIPVLTGSDPLPLPGEDRRPGSCCFALSVSEMEQNPSDALRRGISKLEVSPPRFQEPCSLSRFLFSQGAMQVRKQWRRWRP